MWCRKCVWRSGVELLKSSWNDCSRFMPLMCQGGGPALRSWAFISEITLKADEMSAGCTFILSPFGYKKCLVFFLLHKQLIKNRFLEKYRLILEMKALKFSVKFKYTFCILNCKKVRRGDLMEANFFLKTTGRAKMQEKATSFSLTPHKAYWTYIQPQIHLILLCAQSEWRGDPVVYLYTAPGSRWPHFFLE